MPVESDQFRSLMPVCAPVMLGCSLAKAVEGGDHVLLLGTIEDAEWMDAPLIYGERTFGTHRCCRKETQRARKQWTLLMGEMP